MATLLRKTAATLRLFRALKLPSAIPVRFVGNEDYRPDYYSALGVSKVADTKQIKLAYFRMAKKYHPVNIFNFCICIVKFSGAQFWGD